MLQATDLTTGYAKVVALQSVSLTVAPGEVVAVVGANGAGKSTLLSTLAGLQRPWSGRIHWEGQEITALPGHKRAALGMALVPEGRRLFRGLSAETNLRLGAYLRRDKAAVEADLAWLFELFPVLRDRRRQIAGNMSGGEQQMCAIGRALMGRPRLLMVDELSAGLAPVIVSQLLEALLRVRQERGLTLLLIEQDVHAALTVADRGYVLAQGRTALSGPAGELLERDEVRRAYLGM